MESNELTRSVVASATKIYDNIEPFWTKAILKAWEISRLQGCTTKALYPQPVAAPVRAAFHDLVEQSAEKLPRRTDAIRHKIAIQSFRSESPLYVGIGTSTGQLKPYCSFQVTPYLLKELPRGFSYIPVAANPSHGPASNLTPT